MALRTLVYLVPKFHRIASSVSPLLGIHCNHYMDYLSSVIYRGLHDCKPFVTKKFPEKNFHSKRFNMIVYDNDGDSRWFIAQHFGVEE
jgi:hypothetical protein